MALNLDKLVQDAKRSGTAKQAVVFLVQNIATLINDAGGDPERAKQLMEQLNARAADMADSVIDNRDVIPPAQSPMRVNPAEPPSMAAVEGFPADEVKREGDLPKPRLDGDKASGDKTEHKPTPHRTTHAPHHSTHKR